MAQPIVTFRDSMNPAIEITSWPIGVVDAGVVSAELAVDVWNNYAGATDVSNMQNTKITLKDSTGGDNLDMVRQKWAQVKNLSKAESAFTAIGGTDGVSYGSGMVGKEHAIGAETAAAGEIGGYANDGSKSTADTKRNFCSLVLRALPPLNATAGVSNFLVKIAYQYT